MTTRPAAQCDQCGEIVLLDPHRLVGHVPDGWLVVHGPVAGVPDVSDPRADFCSWHCAAKYSAVARLMEAGEAAQNSDEFWKSVKDTDKPYRWADMKRHLEAVHDAGTIIDMRPPTTFPNA